MQDTNTPRVLQYPWDVTDILPALIGLMVHSSLMTKMKLKPSTPSLHLLWITFQKIPVPSYIQKYFKYWHYQDYSILEFMWTEGKQGSRSWWTTFPNHTICSPLTIHYPQFLASGELPDEWEASTHNSSVKKVVKIKPLITDR